MADSAPIHTGFIGLGQQGGPMAARMHCGDYPLTVWARRAEALVNYIDKGAVAAASIAELGATCDHVGICVVDDSGVRAICDLLIPAMRAGSLLVIHSTILPESCVRLAAECAGRGVGFLDAPVSGGGGAAAAGTLTVMCGGSDHDFARGKPVMETFAGTLVHLGPAGSGQRAKIVNNALMAANMGLAQAALRAGEGLGLDRTALADLIKVSSGRSFAFEVFARLPTPTAFSHGAPLLTKDVDFLTCILPGNEGAGLLRDAADTFLSTAMAGDEVTDD